MKTFFENEITLTPNIVYEYMLTRSGAASKYAGIAIIIGLVMVATGSFIDKNIVLLFTAIILIIIAVLFLKFFPRFLSNIKNA